MCVDAGGHGGQGGRTGPGGVDASFGLCEVDFGGFLAAGAVF